MLEQDFLALNKDGLKLQADVTMVLNIAVTKARYTDMLEDFADNHSCVDCNCI